MKRAVERAMEWATEKGIDRGLAGRAVRVLAVALPFTMLVACGDGGPDGSEGEDAAPGAEPAASADSLAARDGRDSVAVVFSRGEEPAPVRRPVPADAPELRTPGARLRVALELLLRGPTPEERAAGIDSWFSEETAGALDTVTVDSAGHAVVDFRDLPALIPSASSSAGSEMLLQQLNGTVFGIPAVRSVEYRVNGSCARFWEWLQYECRVVEREEASG